MGGRQIGRGERDGKREVREKDRKEKERDDGNVERENVETE